MQTFRKKYVFNPENPVYSSAAVRTYNCLNTETKEKRLIILHHLQDPPFVEPSPSVLQPVEVPTGAEPYSVYPITRCVSEIGKLSEPEPQAMYVIKCLLEAKIKKPLYSVICKDGICVSEVEGILPNRSPDLFQLAIDLLDLPVNLQEVEKSVVSKQGYSICRALRDGESPLASLQNYGWKDAKKEKDQLYDEEFIVFRGRRKEEGPFGDEYGLAWSHEHGMCRAKAVNLLKQGYEEEALQQFESLMTYMLQAQTQQSKNNTFLRVFKYSKQSRILKVFSQIANHGSLAEFIAKKQEFNQGLTDLNSTIMLDSFISNMARLAQQVKGRGIGTLHIKSLHVKDNRICIGQPLFVTDKIEKKLRELKNSMDYFAPELKENIILPENLARLDREKMDVWSFGQILHKLLTRQIPVFDANKQPILNKDKLSLGIQQLIARCLDLNPANRPRWTEINIKEIVNKSVYVEEVKQAPKEERVQIRLDSRADRRREELSRNKSFEDRKAKEEQELRLNQERERKREQEQEEAKLKQQQEEEQLKFIAPIPTEISSRLKKIKLVVKLIAVMLLYIFVFFRVFWANTISVLSVRSLYTTAAMKLVDYTNNLLSTVTVITNDPVFFLKNDISFDQIQTQYNCIDNNFDPIFNPNYSLLDYIHSGEFMGLALGGWAAALLICFIKGLSIWKGGISNRPIKKRFRYWLVYAFHELSLAALLFAHFFMFQFFYFAGASPCLSMANFTGIQPFFDSTLFLFLKNGTGYFQQIFSTLGILAIVLAVSSCFYAWGPKLDQRYFASVPSIVLRVVPFILLLLLCRVGVFLLFSPTAINDSARLIPTIMSSSFQGCIGIIPEIFICITLAAEVAIELLMHWCERKAAESDQLSRLFNIKDKKLSALNDNSMINDMSLVNNSKHKLEDSEIEQV